MIQIRNGCFETNSSSTHAIIIANEEPSFFGNIELSIGEFGWGYNVYNYDSDKASYLYTAACELYQKDVFDDIADMLAPYGVNCYSHKRAEFYTDPNYSYTYLNNGYIDHVEECKEFVDYVMSDPDHLVCFLFNDESYIVTGNDNCDDIDEQWFQRKIHKADSYEHKTFFKGN